MKGLILMAQLALVVLLANAEVSLFLVPRA